MKKHNLIAFFCILLLLLCGCSEEVGAAKLETLFTTTESALESGRLFFGGKVLGVKNDPRLISYYDADMGDNTFYSVEVTEDLFGCMPQRNITVCVLGSSETFPDRVPLEKGREYLFDTTLWVEGEQTIFLLPTFHTSLPELREDGVYTVADGKSAYCGSFADYRARLNALVSKTGYSPATVLQAAKSLLQSAAERDDASYFEELGLENVEDSALKQTASTAASLLKQAENTEETWKGIKELIQ